MPGYLPHAGKAALLPCSKLSVLGKVLGRAMPQNVHQLGSGMPGLAVSGEHFIPATSGADNDIMQTVSISLKRQARNRSQQGTQLGFHADMPSFLAMAGADWEPAVPGGDMDPRCGHLHDAAQPPRSDGVVTARIKRCKPILR